MQAGTAAAAAFGRGMAGKMGRKDENQQPLAAHSAPACWREALRLGLFPLSPLCHRLLVCILSVVLLFSVAVKRVAQTGLGGGGSPKMCVRNRAFWPRPIAIALWRAATSAATADWFNCVTMSAALAASTRSAASRPLGIRPQAAASSGNAEGLAKWASPCLPGRRDSERLGLWGSQCKRPQVARMRCVWCLVLANNFVDSYPSTDASLRSPRLGHATICAVSSFTVISFWLHAKHAVLG